MRPRHTIVAVIAVAVGLACVGTASASFAAFADGNDRPGRLDIKQVSEDHGAGGRIVHTITTFGRWPNSLLGPNTPNFFILNLSIDQDVQPERYVYIFATANGHMVAVVTKPSGRIVGSANASRPDRKSVKVSFLPSRIANKPGYRWLAASLYRGRGCSRGCIDFAPNHGRILHDIRAPVVNFPQPTTTQGSTTYNINFTISDLGGSGVASWELQHFNGVGWDPIADSVNDVLPHPFTAATLGGTDDFRVVALDGHGNQGVSAVVSVTTSP